MKLEHPCADFIFLSKPLSCNTCILNKISAIIFTKFTRRGDIIQQIMIVEANLEEAKEIYNKHMMEDFPEDELPEYEKYLRLTEEKLHDVYLYEKDNQNVAYFIVVEEENNILISHLSVMKEFRSKGIGKVFLEDIKNFFNDKNMLIVEVEAETRANNNEELDVIKRRKKYYTRAGFEECKKIEYILLGVEYDILIYVPENNKIYENIEIKKIIEKLYEKLGLDKEKLKINIM